MTQYQVNYYIQEFTTLIDNLQNHTGYPSEYKFKNLYDVESTLKIMVVTSLQN